ncbi:MAG TPA: DUF3438 family protein [Anaerolineae bacterium]|nr:DUF3438 family protein [Anaerolineae bacterium]
MKHVLILLIFCLAAGTVSAADRSQTHIWDKTPIKIMLNVGNERRIEFPEGVIDIKVKSSINEVSRIMTAPGDERVYWTANQPFEESRVIVITASGYHYYLDVSAVKVGGSARPLIIQHKQAQDDPGSGSAQTLIEYDYVDLVRYAAQHFHGPARLIKPLHGMSRQSLPYQVIPHLIRDNSVEARPIIQWRSRHPGLYLTAVEIVNKSHQPVELIPTAVRGDFLFAAPHNSVLYPAGELGDTSLFYLISKQPFKQAVMSFAGVARHE